VELEDDIPDLDHVQVTEEGQKQSAQGDEQQQHLSRAPQAEHQLQLNEEAGAVQEQQKQQQQRTSIQPKTQHNVQAQLQQQQHQTLDPPVKIEQQHQVGCACLQGGPLLAAQTARTAQLQRLAVASAIVCTAPCTCGCNAKHLAH
jgi:hypothetical protein